MAARRDFQTRMPMASRWRRRRMCLLAGPQPAPAALRSVSASGAFLETNARPALGTQVTLAHPEAGSIIGEVSAFAEDGVALRFVEGEASVAFALAAITSDMSRAV
jgi:hypothetical protein